MAKFVIKKDGTKEPFDAEKLKNAIVGAVGGGKTAEKVFGAVMQLAGGKEDIATSELRDKILSELNALEPAAAKRWVDYEQKKAEK